MINLTERQRELCNILSTWPDSQLSPTRRELAQRLGKTPGAINQLLARMESRGVVRVHRGWRGIELLVRPAAHQEAA